MSDEQHIATDIVRQAITHLNSVIIEAAKLGVYVTLDIGSYPEIGQQRCKLTASYEFADRSEVPKTKPFE